MKRFFLRSLAYLGLYAEIFSATCRWLSYSPRREQYKTFVTKALIAAGYLPPLSPPREAIELYRAQQEKIAQHDFNVWVAAQPETIQTCLRINRKALAALRASRQLDPLSGSVFLSPRTQEIVFPVVDAPPGPAIPEFKK